MTLRCQPIDLPHHIMDYFGDCEDHTVDDAAIAAGESARRRGWVTRDELVILGNWKSPRIRPRLEDNDDDFVQAVTGVALSTPNERLRLEVLTLLRGVGYPVASAILHLAHTDPYPIYDVRALWTLGLDAEPESFDLWRRYTDSCRDLAGQTGLSMRDLDRALWGYSKKHQLSN